MNDEFFKLLVKNRIFIARSIWFAMMSGSMIVVAVPFIFSGKDGVNKNLFREGLWTSPVLFGLMIIAFFSVILSFNMHRFFKIKEFGQFDRNQFVDGKRKLQTKRGEKIWSEENIKKLESMPHEELKIIAILDKTYPRYICELAFVEFCMILGFIAYQLSGHPEFILPFLALSSAAFSIKWPDQNSLTRNYEKKHQEKF